MKQEKKKKKQSKNLPNIKQRSNHHLWEPRQDWKNQINKLQVLTPEEAESPYENAGAH